MVDEPEGGWTVPASFDAEAFKAETAKAAEQEKIRRWLTAEQAYLVRPLLRRPTETGVYPLNPRSKAYENGNRFASHYNFPGSGGSVGGWHATESEAYESIRRHKASSDRFWQEKVDWKNNGDRHRGQMCLRIDGRHYIPAYLGTRPNDNRDCKGFGGAVLRWRFLADPDSKVHTSDSVYTQGEIPVDWRDRLPDNAEWVKS